MKLCCDGFSVMVMLFIIMWLNGGWLCLVSMCWCSMWLVVVFRGMCLLGNMGSCV